MARTGRVICRSPVADRLARTTLDDDRGRCPVHDTGVPPMMDVGLGHYLVVSAILLVLGIFGIFLNRKNVIVILMAIELILLSVNLNFVAFSAAHNDLAGQVMAMLVLTVAAAEAAIGLAIVVIYFRNRGSIQVEDVNLMKG
jgi:NADH-quinone oxidoreductase subunit K